LIHDEIVIRSVQYSQNILRSQTKLTFYLNYKIHKYMHFSVPQIRPSVCLSDSGTVSKQENAEECGLDHRVAQCL